MALPYRTALATRGATPVIERLTQLGTISRPATPARPVAGDQQRPTPKRPVAEIVSEQRR